MNKPERRKNGDLPDEGVKGNGWWWFCCAIAFYHRPKTTDDIVSQTVDRVLDLLAVEHPDLFKRWTGPQNRIEN